MTRTFMSALHLANWSIDARFHESNPFQLDDTDFAQRKDDAICARMQILRSAPPPHISAKTKHFAQESTKQIKIESREWNYGYGALKKERFAQIIANFLYGRLKIGKRPGRLYYKPQTEVQIPLNGSWKIFHDYCMPGYTALLCALAMQCLPKVLSYQEFFIKE